MNTNNLTLSNNDKLALISNISTMLSAGIPILETIDSLLEDSKGNSRKILETLKEDLMQGKHMYASLEKFPLIFDKVTANIVKASEEAGALETTLKDLKTQIKKQMEFTDKVKSAVTYPVFIFFVFVAVILMILIIVVPKISTVFLNLRIPLPLPTRILIFLSNTLLTYTFPVVAGTILFIILIVFLYKTQRQIILHMLFGLPLVDRLVRQIDLTQFSRAMYLLLSSGLTITNALELTEHVVMQKSVSLAIHDANNMVLAGRKLSDGFKDHKNIFSGIMIKIIEAGERTGTLEKSMQDISESLEYQVSNTLKTLTTILEPVMLVVVGIMVGGMMLSIIAPIYNIIGQVGTH